MTKLYVFISSTSEDLERYRAAAADVVRDAGWVPDVMDHFPADPDPIVTLCQRHVGEADLVLLLQAFRRGGVPDVKQGGDGETSYTGFELKTADDLRKPVLVFLASDAHWPGKLYEDDAAARAWVIDFRNKVNRNAKFFEPEEGELRNFKGLIREAIGHHKERVLHGTPHQGAGAAAGAAPASQTTAPVGLRAAPPVEFPDAPYPLLRPYEHPDTFAGRDAELHKLDILLRRPQLVLCLHAPSGAGKSSLLGAGLVPQLRAAGFPVSLERRPGEPGLAHRLVADLLELPPSVRLDDDQPNVADEFAHWIEHAGALAGKPPVLIVDQVDDVLRQPDARDRVLARLGPLMAKTAQRVPGGQGFACRWVLCYRHEFHGEVEEWLRDVLSQARRAGRPGLEPLPHDLSDADRLHSWPLPLLGAPQPGEPAEEVARRVFQAAIERPLTLRLDGGRARYRVRFGGAGVERLAGGFAETRAKQPHAPLAPELQVVLSHLLEAATTGPEDVLVVHVPEDPAHVETIIDDALAKHLRQALERAFPLTRDPKAARAGRARALLALRELADDSGRRGEGLPRDEMVAILGDGGEAVLQELASPRMRLVVEEPRLDGFVCTLAHDRMAEVILRFVQGQSGASALDIDRPVVEMKRSVALRSTLFEGKDDTALSLTPEQHAVITAHAPALVRSDAERQWWQQSDAWFTLAEGLRRDPASGFRVLIDLARNFEADWTPLLRSAGIAPDIFWGAWALDPAPDPDDVVRVVERTYPAFLAPAEMFRAVSHVVEEALRRRPALAPRVQALRAAMREAFTREAAGAPLPPLFKGDAWHLPDEPLLGFVEIPAGPFQMGSDKSRDSLADNGEIWPAASAPVPPAKGMLRRLLSTPESGGPARPGGGANLDLPTFHLARFPVTVAQFRAFVEASGFKPGNSQWLSGQPEHPVVYVSWPESLEYCRWLERTLRASDTAPEGLKRLLAGGCHGGLPSEAEWEKAARGADGRIYPWGETIDPSRANYDAGLKATSLVGAFPRGASPYGILDMSGNVWEWTRSLNQPYPYDPADGRENLSASPARVVRGGSFYNDVGLVRAANRGGSDPVLRDDSLGFRVVVSRSCS